MKKIISAFAIMLATFASSGTMAQDKSVVAFNSPEIKKAMMLTMYNNSVIVTAATVSKKAIKDFNKSFKNATGTNWYLVEDGFFAAFNDNGIETKVAYDQNGKWHCTVRTLDETQLPADIRDVVKREYYDSKILVGYEIEHNEGPVYIIKTQDSKSLKTLRVTSAEMEVISEYTNG